MRNYTCIVILFFLFPLLGEARVRLNKDQGFALTVYSTSYSNLSLSDGVSQELDPSIDLELAFRLSGIFQGLLVANHFLIDDEESNASGAVDSRSGYGLGLKIDLPGFFLMGGSRRDFLRNYKLYPLNTSIYATAMQTTTTSTSGSFDSVAVKYGFTVDLFLLNHLWYISLSPSVYSFSGDSHLSLGIGLGFSF